MAHNARKGALDYLTFLMVTRQAWGGVVYMDFGSRGAIMYVVVKCRSLVVDKL